MTTADETVESKMTGGHPGQDDLTSLAEKLNGLDLTNSESLLLGVMLTASEEDPEIAGYEQRFAVEIGGFNIGMPPTKVWTDPAPQVKVALGRAY